ncbi:SpoIIE family protein phosphatase [bacterium]|nr:SpoIIE family protein phosphatase [bacterium]
MRTNESEGKETLAGILSKLFKKPVVQKYEIEVTAEERHLGEIRDFITQVSVETGFSQHEINNIKLALDEACSNVVRHAYKGMEPGSLKLEVLRRTDEMEVVVIDRGKSFEWKKSKTPDLNRYVEIGKRGGLGIWFIRKLMDDADYKSTRQGNRLRLLKKVKAGGKKIGQVPALPEGSAETTSAVAQPKQRRMSSVSIKYLFPVTISVAVLVLVIFAYMFSNQAKSMRSEIISSAMEATRRLAQDSENYLLKHDDLHLTGLVKTMVQTNTKLAYAFIVDNENLIYAHSVTQKMFKSFTPGPGFKLPKKQETVIQSIQDGNKKEVHNISASIYLGDMRLGTAHIGVLEDAILQDIKTGRKNAVLIFFIALAVSTSGAYFLMAFLIAPIRKLTDGMLAVSQGKLDHRIMIQSNDEFGQIANVFNEMTQKFNAAQHNLLEQERLQQEMQVAQEIQHTLLPRELPKIEGYEVASYYRSAKEVGGDYFDFVWVDDNVLGVAVADVSGKGIPGSLVMTMIRTALRLEARGNHNATEVMDKVNAFVTRDMKKGMFVTMFYIILDARRRVINYSSAGHNPMILYREENEEVYFLKPRGFPLGIDLPNPDLFRKSLTQESVKLKKGDLLLVYTDGITEAMNPRREQYGEQRLIDLMKQNHKLSAEDFIGKLSDDIVTFTEDYPQNDDITCVAVKEKMMADDVQFNLRRKLFYLVEEKGVSVREACRHLNVSTTTYYRLKQLRDKHGIKALRSNIARKDVQMQQLSLAERQQIVDAVMRNPLFGSKRISEDLAKMKRGKVKLSPKMVYQELKRLRLSTREEREEYVAKKKVD